MYPYHNKIKSRIRAGELTRHYFTDHYPGIGECMVLVFSTYPFIRPIRPHRYAEYVDILAEWGKKQNDIGRNQGIGQAVSDSGRHRRTDGA